MGTFSDTNNWSGSETPNFAIDGLGQNYLNFGEANTGILVTPAFGSSTVTQLTIWTAYNAEESDPASYQVWGTNAPIGTGPYMLTVNNPNAQMRLDKNPNFHTEYYPNEGMPKDKANGLLALAGKKLPLIHSVIFSLEKSN